MSDRDWTDVCSIALSHAVLCGDCGSIHNRPDGACPACTSAHGILVSNILDGPEAAKLRQARAELESIVATDAIRLRAALEEIAALPCDCPQIFLDGSHFHDCQLTGPAVTIAKKALEPVQQRGAERVK